MNTEATQLPYDDMYEALIACHQGLSTEQSHMVNARLVLLLVNHISDMAVLREAFAVARAGVGSENPSATSDKQAVSMVASVHAD